MNTRHPFLDTCDELVARRTPNLFRLHLNPHVVEACFCLNRYIQETWHSRNPEKPPYQSFLANSFDEALSGAIKLARYAAGVEKRPQKGLVLDCNGQLGPFVSVTIGGESRIEFVPSLKVLEREEIERGVAFGPEDRFGFVVLVLSPALESYKNVGDILEFIERQSLVRIVCVDRPTLNHCRGSASTLWKRLAPDVVVFDESFAHHHVPFGAFAARRTLYDYWNVSRNATFHSTTYQPNSISSLHFLKCLEKDDPDFLSSLAHELESIRTNPAICEALLSDLYNPSLRKTISLLGLDTLNVQAAGHYVIAEGRRIFDGVGGVACSVRGHNPENYIGELADLHHVADPNVAVSARLRELTGLEHLLPAVSGASAVENALRIGLAAQHPKEYVLVLKGGFGGKTLLALTGTARESYKKHLGPLYEKVVYVDPFAKGALQSLDDALENYPIGIVQMELIQAVGGVRAIPERVVRHLESRRHERNYLLFVDEVQTGMYRTGPFTLSAKMSVSPDLLTIGKGTSDMMFPFAVTLYSESVQTRLDAIGSCLPRSLRRRCDYEFGYKTLLNTLTRAEKIGLSETVSESSGIFAKLLSDRLSSCRAVRDVRVFGLLIAIELNTNNWLLRWLKGKTSSFYIYDLLRNASFPVFMGYCQYEPNVLKFTPPLSITHAEIEQVCDAISATLHKPFHRLFFSVLRTMATISFRDKWKAYRRETP
ncbi:MAG TPA: aminotransferase class III-fold pyridoxal phosphate-dependent enzyme [Gemmataceae bacterium]|jgi:acetylornithine/succinyldiaminopimelate/putrescine aminotransferase